jgi:hypothetical protein
MPGLWNERDARRTSLTGRVEAVVVVANTCLTRDTPIAFTFSLPAWLTGLSGPLALGRHRGHPTVGECEHGEGRCRRLRASWLGFLALGLRLKVVSVTGTFILPSWWRHSNYLYSCKTPRKVKVMRFIIIANPIPISIWNWLDLSRRHMRNIMSTIA